DAHPADVAETGADDLDERSVARGAETVWHEGREPPVLALGCKVVGRSAYRHTRGQHVLPCPGIGALAIEADREIGSQGKRSAGPSELLVEQRLEPRVEGDPLGSLGGEARDGERRRMPMLGRPAPPPRSVMLGKGAEGRELVEPPPLLGPV